MRGHTHTHTQRKRALRALSGCRPVCLEQCAPSCWQVAQLGNVAVRLKLRLLAPPKHAISATRRFLCPGSDSKSSLCKPVYSVLLVLQAVCRRRDYWQLGPTGARWGLSPPWLCHVVLCTVPCRHRFAGSIEGEPRESHFSASSIQILEWLWMENLPRSGCMYGSVLAPCALGLSPQETQQR